MRYSYYSHIHRFMRSRLFDFEKTLATADFRLEKSRIDISDLFKGMSDLLDGHAGHENKHHVKMLEARGSQLCKELEREHHELDAEFEKAKKILGGVMAAQSSEQQVELGYKFYLAYTSFVASYLKHLIQEEQVIMPELQRLYTDEELRGLTFETYRDPTMTLEAMQGMLGALFPYADAYNREVFLRDIKDATPDKFPAIWEFVIPMLQPYEREDLAKKFHVNLGALMEELEKKTLAEKERLAQNEAMGKELRFQGPEAKNRQLFLAVEQGKTHDVEDLMRELNVKADTLKQVGTGKTLHDSIESIHDLSVQTAMRLAVNRILEENNGGKKRRREGEAASASAL